MTREVTYGVGSAIFSECMTWRYLLTRRFTGFLQPRGACTFVMLNPSTADWQVDDPTVRGCAMRARAWGFSSLEVVNLFGLRSTDPRGLYHHPDPVGPENTAAIFDSCKRAELVICAWGDHGRLHGRAADVLGMIQRAGVVPHALRLNLSGHPSHPLYLPHRLQPAIWQPRTPPA